MVQPDNVRGPVGHCIYCGSNHGKLTKEHIVPEALGGVHILTRASCDRCREWLNHRVDKPAIGALMQGRAAYGFKSKRPKSRRISVVEPGTAREFNAMEFTKEYPVDGYFGSVLLPTLAGPPALLHPESKKPGLGIWCDQRDGHNLLMDTPLVEAVWAIARMVAKTAYSAAIFDGYTVPREELVSAIRDPLVHVGGVPNKEFVYRARPYHLDRRIDGDKLIYHVQFFTSAPMAYAFNAVFRL